MPDELGAGFFLDQTLDFGISSSGDLRASRGEDELNKDIGFQLKIVLGEIKGQPLTPDVKGEIKSLTVDTLRSDIRVLSVREGQIKVTETDRQTLAISAVYDTVAGQQERVFNI